MRRVSSIKASSNFRDAWSTPIAWGTSPARTAYLNPEDFDPPARIMTIDGLSNTVRNNILGRNAQRLFGIHKLPEPARLLRSSLGDTSVER